MKRIQNLLSFFKKSEFEKNLAALIGYQTKSIVLFQTALNHRSVRENPAENNERLEFLGDAIISSVVADYLFKKYPYKGEGFLTEMRSKMVNRQQLNHIAVQMGLRKMTRFNKMDGSLFPPILEYLRDIPGMCFNVYDRYIPGIFHTYALKTYSWNIPEIFFCLCTRILGVKGV